MVRALVTVVVNLIANVIVLIVADVVLDDMSLDASGFLIAVLIFTLIEVVAQPLIIQMSLKSSSALRGSSALIASFVALVITAVVSDGLQIEGLGTWVIATIIVWAAAIVAGILLPALVFKRWLQDDDARR